MAAASKRFATSLEVLRRLQEGGRNVFRSDEIGRVHRERLEKMGFLQRVIGGWLISSGPAAKPGDTTPFYASFWEFIARYCEHRFHAEWHLSVEQSLALHAGDISVPKQVIVFSPKAANNVLALPFGLSIFDGLEKEFPKDETMLVDGLRVFSLPSALTRAPEHFFQRHALDASVALSGIVSSPEILRPLLNNGRETAAGRLAGAFRHIDRGDVADDILTRMRRAGFSVQETNPFVAVPAVRTTIAAPSPAVRRLDAAWHAMRGRVIETFPAAVGLINDRAAYLKRMDEVYVADAYHSLSIEGYRVTPELIERVAKRDWDPTAHEADRRNVDAMAALGYLHAFRAVKNSVSKILDGAAPGPVVRADHDLWYHEMFSPCVAAGILKPEALAGYRSHPVYIQGSRHVPMRHELLGGAMSALFDLLTAEPEPSVRAVLGHFLLGYIHPYPDGNGRMARFLMNTMLASGGYPWTIIPVDDRNAYLSSLESASVESDIGPFARFLSDKVSATMKEVVHAVGDGQGAGTIP